MILSQVLKFRFAYIIYLLCSMVYSSVSFAVNIPREHFPIENYSQDINTYISSKNSNYTQNLLSPESQALRLKQFYQHYYASDSNGLSPWSEALVQVVLPAVKQDEIETLNYFNNQTKNAAHKHYAENFREHPQTWWHAIQKNMNLNALDTAHFQNKKRAIVVNNTFTRTLPDNAPDFFDERVAGEGFPFDNFQIASLWVGTPLYVLNTSKDKAWSLVLTPDAYFAWVKSTDIADVSPEFVEQWQRAAQKKLVAVTKTETSILNQQNNFQFTGYIGAVFPLKARDEKQTAILIPVKNTENQAVIKTGIIDKNAAALMPLSATPKNMAHVIGELQHRPYGWGGAFFLNDCSQELKSLFTPFGIWLPRNSGLQAKLNKSIDLSKYTLDERLKLIQSKGHPLMTLIYKPGHIMLYVGHKTSNHQSEVMSYQNVWALSSKHVDTRYVIGSGVFLPILKSYSDSPHANSQANESKLKLIYLDQLNTDLSPQAFAKSFL